MDDLERLVDSIRELDDEIRELDERKRKLRSRLTEELIALDEDEAVGSDGSKCKLVQPEKVAVDEAALERKLGERWLDVSTRTLDKDKLELMVKKGVIHGQDVADCTTISKGTAYVRLERAK